VLEPYKKSRVAELTDEQKAANRAHSRRRVRIEHVNSSVKRCRMLKDRIRLTRGGSRDLVMEVACALHNLRLRFRPWSPMH
jgi:hypothetical protein